MMPFEIELRGVKEIERFAAAVHELKSAHSALVEALGADVTVTVDINLDQLSEALAKTARVVSR